MIHNTSKSFVGLAAGTFLASLAVGAWVSSSVIPSSVENVTLDADAVGAHASWVSSAESVSEQVLEADLVVRVQSLDRAEPRHLWHPMPAGVSRIDGQGTFAFTDTEVEVLEVLNGDAKVGDRLWVMQTGADLQTRDGKIARLELSEDPLYQLGDEMVLFLVDISGDKVHAADRQLYRTVNPAGRYQVEGGLVGRLAPGDHAKVQTLELASLREEVRIAAADRAELER